MPAYHQENSIFKSACTNTIRITNKQTNQTRCLEFQAYDIFFNQSFSSKSTKKFDNGKINSITWPSQITNLLDLTEKLLFLTKTLISSENNIYQHPIYKYQMQAVINQLQRSENYKENLRQACKLNRVSQQVLKGLTIGKMRIFHERTLKHYNSNPVKAITNWFQNQLRLYHWLLIIHSFLFKYQLNQFNTQHWAKIQAFFPLKSLTILQFQAKKLISTSPSQLRRGWTPEQCELLKKIMEDEGMINRWNQVSLRLYEQSGKRWYRSNKQCRQQWFNHLDHFKKHGQWTQQQDVTILSFVLKNGHKWAQLCRNLLNHRTEHMIKNRFKSLIIRNRPQKFKLQYNERKIIRNALSKSNKQSQQLPNTTFKVRNLKTFQTSNQMLQSQQREQFSQPPLPLEIPIQQINKSSSQRQIYQNGPLNHPDPPPQYTTLQPSNSIYIQYPNNIYPFCPSFQQTQYHIPNISFTPLIPNLYPPFSNTILFNPTFPHNLF